ncbi:hypothetical protein C0J27_00970 [Candidatus Chromulinivorax destructor]|uniref:YicC family protein n=2 Tax=Candidatus Chromulinivorax destructor TaxID=2066483 RepID=A0A345ZAK5_9BACT|nr:hypothetical protein C0J27_00970 [Candidatus Chromulinivorax destructor]
MLKYKQQHSKKRIKNRTCTSDAQFQFYFWIQRKAYYNVMTRKKYMVLSMTGFATSTAEIALANNSKMILSLSIKSLNSRFFEMTCKLPSILSNLEIPIQRVLQKQLHRGHIFLHIKITNQEALQESVTPSIHTIQNYLDAIEIIQKKFDLHDKVTLSQILQLPNALQNEEVELNEEVEAAIVKAAYDLSVQLIQAQQKEGALLAHDIKQQLTSMQSKIEKIQTLSMQFIKEKKEALTHVMSLLLAFPAEQEQKSQEQCLLEAKKSTLLYEIEKIDINEETVRFNSHLINLASQFETTETAKGKKIDFIIQELNREINTIAAKCSQITISSLAIDIKSELEKAREQGQNII